MPGKLCFGTGERLHSISPTNVSDSTGVPLELAVKITTKCFGLPYTVRSDGLVLKVVGQTSTYHPMPTQLETARLQNSGQLPSPLPSTELGTADLLFGHFLWFVLIAAGVAMSITAKRALREINKSGATQMKSAVSESWLNSIALGALGVVAILAGFGAAYLLSIALKLA